jgi:hypothetical protein
LDGVPHGSFSGKRRLGGACYIGGNRVTPHKPQSRENINRLPKELCWANGGRDAGRAVGVRWGMGRSAPCGATLAHVAFVVRRLAKGGPATPQRARGERRASGRECLPSVSTTSCRETDPCPCD